MTEAGGPIKLHLGCGTKKLSGWVNVDSVKECRPDLWHDITLPLPFPDLAVAEILAEDLLEHFDKYMRFVVFAEWARVLKVGGRLTLQVPDFKKLLLRYFKFGYDKFVDMVFGENMWQSQFYLGHFGNHKWGYSAESLQEFVGHFGIRTVDLKKIGLNLRLVGEKERHVLLSDLEALKIYAHANAVGQGQAEISLGQARAAINTFQQGI